MKKIFFFVFAVVGLLSSCKKDDPIVKPPDPPPIENTIKITGTIDFPSPDLVTGFYIALVDHRQGENIDAHSIFGADATWLNFSFVLPHSADSLIGKTYEILVEVSYRENGSIYSGRVVKSVNFTDVDTTDHVVNVNLGDIGFSNYDWTGWPRLKLVILPGGEKFYVSEKK
ncbi:MAG: hypothetical protein ACOYMB_01350 [Patescibacteria group bacterium]